MHHVRGYPNMYLYRYLGREMGLEDLRQVNRSSLPYMQSHCINDCEPGICTKSPQETVQVHIGSMTCMYSIGDQYNSREENGQGYRHLKI